jgi:Na+/melibiose symporter-like transporter
MLLGQIADALSTIFIGFESDRTEHGLCNYGRRKSWHLVGVISILISFPFMFNLCITCENTEQWALFYYYAPFVVIFQFGWAATQISHLSLIPQLTSSKNERVALNAIR